MYMYIIVSIYHTGICAAWSPEAGDLLWEWTREQVLLAKVTNQLLAYLVQKYLALFPGHWIGNETWEGGCEIVWKSLITYRRSGFNCVV